jgi:predicted SprT family Zn-dependent metalloprotease
MYRLTREQALEITLDSAQGIWRRFNDIFPALYAFEMPKIELNGRFTVTAGTTFYRINTIELGYKFYDRYLVNMLTVILPHEIAHQVDYNLFGKSEVEHGHGMNWCAIMRAYGLEPDRYHDMRIK